MDRRYGRAATLALAASVLAGPSARAASFIYTALEPPADVKAFYPGAVNARGQVVGTYLPLGPGQHMTGFVWAGGHYTILDRLQLGDINDSGIAVGILHRPNHVRDPVVYDTNTGALRLVDLGAGSVPHSGVLSSINNRNEIIGGDVSATDGSYRRLLVGMDGSVTPIAVPGALAGVPGEPATGLLALSDDGTVLGDWSYSDGSHRPPSGYFTYTHGKLKLLDGSNNASYLAIGPRGRLGGSVTRGGQYRGLVLPKGGDRIAFDFPGAIETRVAFVTASGVYGTERTAAGSGWFLQRGGAYHTLSFPGAKLAFLQNVRTTRCSAAMWTRS